MKMVDETSIFIEIFTIMYKYLRKWSSFSMYDANGALLVFFYESYIRLCRCVIAQVVGWAKPDPTTKERGVPLIYR
jgi:hypothetical protein